MTATAQVSISNQFAVPFAYTSPSDNPPLGGGSNSARCIRAFFSVTATQVDEMNVLLTDVGLFGGVQTIFVDNSANATASLTLLFRGTNQLISCAKASQGYYAVMGSPNQLDVVGASTGTLNNIPVWFINVPMTPIVYAS